MTDRTGPICPFCAAPWTVGMLAQFDAMSTPGGCACCTGAHTAPAAAMPLPTDDLCCDACGKPIYLNPHKAGG